jgi:hypothetical protein
MADKFMADKFMALTQQGVRCSASNCGVGKFSGSLQISLGAWLRWKSAACPSADNSRQFRRFSKKGSGSSGLEFKRPAGDAASVWF